MKTTEAEQDQAMTHSISLVFDKASLEQVFQRVLELGERLPCIMDAMEFGLFELDVRRALPAGQVVVAVKISKCCSDAMAAAGAR